MFESAPQLATQWLVIHVQSDARFLVNYNYTFNYTTCTRNSLNGENTTDEYDHLANNINNGMSWLQFISILTSTFMIIHALIQFVATSRRRQFISRRCPSLASLLPLYLMLLSGIGAATTQFGWRLPIDGALYDCYSFWLINDVNCIFIVVILSLPSQPSISWRAIRTILHLIATGFAIGLILKDIVTFQPLLCQKEKYESWLRWVNAHHTFRLTFACCIANLILGVLILPCKDWAPRLFAPMVCFFVGGFRRMATFCCPERWRRDAMEMLNNLMLAEGEREVVVGVQLTQVDMEDRQDKEME